MASSELTLATYHLAFAAEHTLFEFCDLADRAAEFPVSNIVIGTVHHGQIPVVQLFFLLERTSDRGFLRGGVCTVASIEMGE
jgi:hypothetical protein